MDLEFQYYIFELGLLFIIFLGLAYLLGLSMLVRDTQLIVEKPLIFIIELILMAALPGVPILFFVVSRGISWNTAWTWYASLSTKFAIFHILSEISGFYRWLFS